jgi:hypothetical protein
MCMPSGWAASAEGWGQAAAAGVEGWGSLKRAAALAAARWPWRPPQRRP